MSLQPPRPNRTLPQELQAAPSTQPASPIRTGLLAFGAALALGGVWILLPALVLPQAANLPLDSASAAAAASHRDAALWAARLGAIRGDLFAQAAYADANLLWPDRDRALDDASAARMRAAKANTETALALSPVKGSAWLYLAQLRQASDGSGASNSLSPLQMSYFTAPNDPALARPRIQAALGSSAPLDKDLMAFIKGDLREILARQPRQEPAIRAAYKAASPQNQTAFEALVAEVDPQFSQSLRNEMAR
jgi:hypothetical protein